MRFGTMAIDEILMWPRTAMIENGCNVNKWNNAAGRKPLLYGNKLPVEFGVLFS